MFNPKWLPLQLAEISNSKKKQSAEIFLSNLEIKLHIWKERKHNLKLQKLNFVLELYSINRINTFLKRNKIWYEELCCINRIITFLKRKKKWCKHVKTEFCFRKKKYERNENVIENFLHNNLCTPVSKYLKNTKTWIVKDFWKIMVNHC